MVMVVLSGLVLIGLVLIRISFARFYDSNLMVGKGHVSPGQVYLRHMATHAIRLGHRTRVRC